MRTILASILAAVVYALAGAADASPFHPMFDFRDTEWAPPGPVTSHTVHQGGYDITLEALAFDGSGGFFADGTLYWDDGDGFGIKGSGYESDEIEDPEVLSIRFDTSLFVERVLLADFYAEGSFSEQGSFSADGGSSWTTFSADGGDDGEVELLVGVLTELLLFTAPGHSGGEDHEYAVAGFDVAADQYQAALPEPGAALLFSAGLALVGGRRRHLA